MMKILYFSYSYSSHDELFISTYKKYGINIGFVELTSAFRYSYPNISNITYFGNFSNLTIESPSQCLQYIQKFKELVSDFRPDLIQAGPIQTCGFIASRSGCKPLLVSAWGSDLLVASFRDKYWKSVTQETLSNADHILCDCNTVVRTIYELVPNLSCKISCFPWGIDINRFHVRKENLNHGIIKDLNWKNKCIFISTRFWEPFYKVDILLMAFYKAYCFNDKIRLLLIGKGSMEAYIYNFINDNKLENIIYIIGFISNNISISKYYRSCHNYISCSINDGSSIAMLEAMASGLPVVVTDNLSNREWIEDGKNGFLSQNDNSNSVAENIIKCSSLSQNARNNIINQNRSLIEKRANWNYNFHLFYRIICKLFNSDNNMNI